MRFNEVKTQQNKVEQVRKFADWAMDQLGIENPPTINYGNDMGMVNKNRSYGSTNSAGEIWTHIGNRTPADAMRTLCHELIHHKQFELGTARDDMDDEQRLKIEDEANAIAGRMMRAYGKIDGSIYESAATAATSYVLFANGKEAMSFNSESEAKDFIRINRLDPRVYVLKKQVCRYKPVNESTVGNAKLKKQLLKHKKTDYDSIDQMMTDIADECDITPKQLHDNWVDEYSVTPDTWIKRQLKIKQEVNEALDPRIKQKGFAKRFAYDGYKYSVVVEPGFGFDNNKIFLKVRAWQGRVPIGEAKFEMMSDGSNEWLQSDDTKVNSTFRREGIATRMYQIASKYGTVRRSENNLQPDGEQMWASFDRNGLAKQFEKYKGK